MIMELRHRRRAFVSSIHRVALAFSQRTATGLIISAVRVGSVKPLALLRGQSPWRFVSAKKNQQDTDLSISNLKYNSVETLPGFEARAAFTVNSAIVFREDVDIIVPTIVDDTLSYVPLGGDNL